MKPAARFDLELWRSLSGVASAIEMEKLQSKGVATYALGVAVWAHSIIMTSFELRRSELRTTQKKRTSLNLSSVSRATYSSLQKKHKRLVKV